MQEVCELLGIKKLNTTAYHPQCDGMVERFNRTLKTMIRKHVDRFGTQWDRYLPGLVWAYRNTPHELTQEKPSFLLYGFDCRTPTEAALLPPSPVQPADIKDYRQELILSLSSARELAVQSIENAQKKYKFYHDKTASPESYSVGDLVLVRFPQDESGPQRKLSRPRHGPYRITALNDPDVTVVKVYFPQEKQIQVHQSRVQLCPPDLPAGFYWYGNKRHGPGRPPKWVDKLLDEDPPQQSKTKTKQSKATTSERSPPEPSHRYPLRSRVQQIDFDEDLMKLGASFFDEGRDDVTRPQGHTD